MVDVVRVANRAQVQDRGRYVLVMNGLSRYDVVHTRGATFVVNNSPRNPNRQAEMAAALAKAQEFAHRAKITPIYCID